MIFDYNVNKNSIEYNGKHFAYCNGGQSKIVKKLNELHEENEQLKKNCKNYNWYKQYKELLNENEQLKQFKENVIKWVDSQMKFNVKKYIETEDYNFKNENIDLHNFKVFIGIDSND